MIAIAEEGYILYNFHDRWNDAHTQIEEIQQEKPNILYKMSKII